MTSAWYSSQYGTDVKQRHSLHRSQTSFTLTDDVITTNVVTRTRRTRLGVSTPQPLGRLLLTSHHCVVSETKDLSAFIRSNVEVGDSMNEMKDSMRSVRGGASVGGEANGCGRPAWHRDPTLFSSHDMSTMGLDSTKTEATTPVYRRDLNRPVPCARPVVPVNLYVYSKGMPVLYCYLLYYLILFNTRNTLATNQVHYYTPVLLELTRL